MRSEILIGNVIENKKIARLIYKMKIKSPRKMDDCMPGQFINIYLRDQSMLLPRPISICFTKEDEITVIYKIVGRGTLQLSSYRELDEIKISTPLGNGYDINKAISELNNMAKEEKTIAIIGGGLGVPPMLELAKTIREAINKDNQKTKLIAILGYNQETFINEEIEKYCDEIFIAVENRVSQKKSSEKANFEDNKSEEIKTKRDIFDGNLLEMIKANNIEFDYGFSCGPKPMLKAVSVYCEQNSINLQVSLEERMGCGYGACVGCVCQIKEKAEEGIKIINKKVCKDGPIFYGEEVVWDE